MHRDGLMIEWSWSHLFRKQEQRSRNTSNVTAVTCTFLPVCFMCHFEVFNWLRLCDCGLPSDYPLFACSDDKSRAATFIVCIVSVSFEPLNLLDLVLSPQSNMLKKICPVVNTGMSGAGLVRLQGLRYRTGISLRLWI